MKRILLALLLTALAPYPAFAQEKAAEPPPALGFEEVVDNLDTAKNTDLHVQEYWKSA